MGDGGQRRRWEYWWVALRFSLLLCFGEQVSAQIRYSIPEEVKEGSVVGNVAKDLGLDVSTLVKRRFRIVSGSNDALFQINQNNGVLYVHNNIDREELCDGTGACLMNLKIVVENPLEIHYVQLEIKDVNDHSPMFTEKEQHFEIAEHVPPGTRFQIPTARDPDIGLNSVSFYKLSQNDFFDIEIKDSDEDKIPFLILQKSLDRENRINHSFVLTAIDGGNPPRSGSLNITVTVLDVNDNKPVFSQDTYSVTLQENVPIGTIVVQVSATDLDEGLNRVVEYSLGRNLKNKVYDVFNLDSITGEIRVKAQVDFDDTEVYKLSVQASDRGQPPWTVECGVIIKILDVNDNKPEIEVTSLSNMVSEDSKPGTVISLISVNDKDSGINGKVLCSLLGDIPFELKPSFQDNIYSLVTKQRLDREFVSHYDIKITATDCGQPPLSTFKTLVVQISDVNDNSPEFSQNPLELYLVENNTPGASIFSVSATDKDLNENAAISYHIVRGKHPVQIRRQTVHVSWTQNEYRFYYSPGQQWEYSSGTRPQEKSFWRAYCQIRYSITEEPKEGAYVGDLAKDLGFSVDILAERRFRIVSGSKEGLLQINQDNGMFVNGSAEGVEEIPRNVNAGHLVTKVRAYDADIGYNGWLLFSLQEVTDHNLFALDRYTGQIRTLRSFTETDEAEHKLVILVKDNGNVSLSATATVMINVVEPKEAFAASDVKSAVKDKEENSVTFYLIITLGSVSALFIISIVVLIIMQCSKAPDYSPKYLQDANYDGTLCHSIQYRSGDKRYMLVGPRMSIGSAIVPGSNGNTLVVPEHRRRASGECFVLWILFGLNIRNMEQRGYGAWWEQRRRLWTMVALVLFWSGASAQIRYSISEELKEGTVVGNIAKDLGIDLSTLKGRGFRISTLDREKHYEYNVTIVAKDAGQPSLSSVKTISVIISDVNDNSPEFSLSPYTFYVTENNDPGASLFSYLQDANYDGTLCHSIQYRSGDKRYMLVGPRMSIGSTIVPGSNGNTLVVPEHRRRASGETTVSNEGIVEVLWIIAICLENMEQRGCGEWRERPQRVIYMVALVLFWSGASAQIRYSISEGLKEGTVVGNIAKDLGIDLSPLKERGFRIVSGSTEPLFQVNQNDGILYVNRKIDREEVCERSSVCLINLKTVLENPLEIHYVAVEVLDVNDHSPSFPEKENRLEIYESALPGARFQLQAAGDPDGGQYSVQQYKLSHNDHFRLEVKDRGREGKIPILNLLKPLDRETMKRHKLQLTAIDGGKPPRSGTVEIVIDVLDVNDNMPVFTKDSYSVTLNENSAIGTTVVQVTATDLDEGSNAEVFYSFGKNVKNKIRKLFDVNANTDANYDGTLCHSIQYRSGDKRYMLVGPRMSIGSTIVPGSNGNALVVPEHRRRDSAEIRYSVSEELKEGTVVGNIAKDLGIVLSTLKERGFRIVSGSTEPLFQVNQNDGILYVNRKIDREEVCERSSVCLINLKTVLENPLEIHYVAVEVLDVNDHSPSFLEKQKRLEIFESALPGARFQLQAARDPDSGPYSVQQYKLNVNDNSPEFSLSPYTFYVTENNDPGASVFSVSASDLSANGSAEGVEEIPRNVNAGHLVTKVRAYDADIGYNGWLLFSLQEVTDHSLFALDRYTGQIRTLRSFTETDEADHKLVILVKDNGNVSLSATATVIINVVEPKEAFAASDVKRAGKEDDEISVTFYLIISLGSVSALFLISIVVLIIMQCSKAPDYSSKYLQDANYDGTLCHSIQYRSGDKRYMLVGPRMSIGSTIVPGSNGNTLVVPDHRRRASGEIRYSVSEALKEGTVVGNIAKDLGIDLSTLKERGFRIVSGSTEPLFQLNQNDGILYPSLSSVKTISVVVSDVNDNSPEFSLSPYTFYVTENNDPGASVFSVSASDRDIHENALISYHILRDGATATVMINAVEPKEAFAASDVKSAVKDDEENSVTFYLIITLGSVSALFLISIIVLIIMQCSKTPDYSSKYLQDANYDGTLCHSIQYRSGDKRYMLVGPRMSIGSTIVPGSNGNTLVVPDHRRRASGEA
ncbi:unnamed protein product [Coregonus sp. 'balchen']|nr:unnamed protein product [Coregonus sp. 'balchen']